MINPIARDLIVGGSTGGAAALVASGDADLGTDTAGSGRVPAAFGNIVGLKPTIGAISATGTVPACRSLDTISVFARTVDAALAVQRVIAGFDPADPYSRRAPPGYLRRANVPPATAPANGANAQANAQANAGYFLQVGSYKTAADAEQQRARLAFQGFESRVTQRVAGDATYYRVRIGPFSKFEDMNATRQRLSEAGVDTSVIRLSKE